MDRDEFSTPIEIRQFPSFGMTPNALMRSELRPICKFVYAILASHTNQERQCYPSLSRLAKMAGASKTTVKSAIDELRSTGWISYSTQRIGESFVNVYTLNMEIPFAIGDKSTVLPGTVESFHGTPGYCEPVSTVLPGTVRRLNQEYKTSASTPDKSSKPKVAFNFDSRLWDGITDDRILLWERAYPACDIETELAKMAAWLLANPTKRKSQYERFITNWLSRSQDRGGTRCAS